MLQALRTNTLCTHTRTKSYATGNSGGLVTDIAGISVAWVRITNFGIPFERGGMAFTTTPGKGISPGK